MLVCKKIIEVMKSITAIEKSENNKAQGFKFRGIDNVYNELHSKMAETGLFTIPTVLDERVSVKTTKNGSEMAHITLKIKYTFYAEDGSSVESIVVGEAMDLGDKACNKCMAIAHKYALLQVFCIPTEDIEKDPDFNSYSNVNHKKDNKPFLRKEVIDLITKKINNGSNKDELLEKLGVKSSKDILSEEYEQNLMDWLTILKE